MTKSGIAAALVLLATTAVKAQDGVPADPARGAEIYIADCVPCHASAARIMRKISGATPEEKSAWLDTFLDGHHLGDMERKGDLAAYLLGL